MAARLYKDISKIGRIKSFTQHFDSNLKFHLLLKFHFHLSDSRNMQIDKFLFTDSVWIRISKWNRDKCKGKRIRKSSRKIGFLKRYSWERDSPDWFLYIISGYEVTTDHMTCLPMKAEHTHKRTHTHSISEMKRILEK